MTRRWSHDSAEDALFLLEQDVDPEEIARRLEMQPGSVGRALHRAGRTEEARPFWALQERRRRAAR